MAGISNSISRRLISSSSWKYREKILKAFKNWVLTVEKCMYFIYNLIWKNVEIVWLKRTTHDLFSITGKKNIMIKVIKVHLMNISSKKIKGNWKICAPFVWLWRKKNEEKMKLKEKKSKDQMYSSGKKRSGKFRRTHKYVKK